jgi:hypothetical protein
MPWRLRWNRLNHIEVVGLALLMFSLQRLLLFLNDIDDLGCNR